MPRQPFREVWHLWIAPDFSSVERGEREPPWVDQRQLDFPRLRQLLLETFGNGTVDIRVPNDTIDQVTVHFREAMGPSSGAGPDAMRCGDFAEGLHREAGKQAGEVIDTSRPWATLHSLPDRELVPPPVILPLLLEAEDFEDMMFARMAAWSRLGMSKGHPLDDMLTDQGWMDSDDPIAALMEQRKREPEQGYLPDAFRSRLEEILGVEYLREAVVDCGVVHDPLPDWVQRQLG